MIDHLVYQRLQTNYYLTPALVALDRINPVEPEPDSKLAELHYSMLGVDEILNLDGPDGLRKVTYAFDALDESPIVASAILDEVAVAFAGWRDDYIRACFLQSRVQVPEEQGFHGQAVYALWFKAF